MSVENVIIIGSGPAGFSAALYTGRAQLSPLLIAGTQIGGQVALTSEIENYPGFPEGLTGTELVSRMQLQAEKFGARVVYDIVTDINIESGHPYTVKTLSGEYQAWSVIITAGASPRKLNVPGEIEFTGKGVSYCATCDGFFFKGKEVVIAGGGDSAIEEALFLTKFASKILVIHRRDELRANPLLQKKAFANEKIAFLWDSVIEEIVGEQTVESVMVRNLVTNVTTEIPTEGVFIFIGHIPNTDFINENFEKDRAGYLVTDERMMTNIPGIFAAGEIQDPLWRQVATSVGQGTAAGMAAIRYLEEHSEQFGLE